MDPVGMTNASATKALSSRTSTMTNTTVSTTSRRLSLASVGTGFVLALGTALSALGAATGLVWLSVAAVTGGTAAVICGEGSLTFSSAMRHPQKLSACG